MAEESKKEDKSLDTQLTTKEKKKFNQLLREKARLAGSRLNSEFKKQTVTAITAAFAFLIALSWRTPIQNSVNNVISNLGLIGKAVYYEYLSAIIITFVAVLALIFLSRWAAKKE